MFQLAWLKLLQTFGLAPKLHKMKRSGTFNPFGHYSAIGVKRGSRWVWGRWFLLGILFALLAVGSWQTGMDDMGYVCAAFEGISFIISAGAYRNWADPPCPACGLCVAGHMKSCSWNQLFRHYETEGWHSL